MTFRRSPGSTGSSACLWTELSPSLRRYARCLAARFLRGIISRAAEVSGLLSLYLQMLDSEAEQSRFAQLYLH